MISDSDSASATGFGFGSALTLWLISPMGLVDGLLQRKLIRKTQLYKEQ